MLIDRKMNPIKKDEEKNKREGFLGMGIGNLFGNLKKKVMG
jgi:hypothetical protein